MLSLSKGQKGRFKESGIEFEIVDTSQSSYTSVRYHWVREVVVFADNDLRASERKGA